jgi:hypothetical protein
MGASETDTVFVIGPIDLLGHVHAKLLEIWNLEILLCSSSNHHVNAFTSHVLLESVLWKRKKRMPSK